MMKTRISFAIVLTFLLSILLSACGSNENTMKEAAKPSAKPAETAAATTPAATPAAAPAEKKKTTITHVMGQTEVPERVERVVALTPHFADHLLALGITSVGSVVREAGDFEPYSIPLLKGTESVGQSSAPNLEKVLQLKPDLIFGEEKNHSKSYPALSKIAPTLVYATKDMEEDWNKVFLSVGEAVGKTALAKTKLQEFDNKTKALKEKLVPKLGNETVLFVKVTDKDTRVMGNKSPLGKIAYTQLGLKYPAGLPEEDGEIKIALEKLPEINPDHIFLLDTNVPDYVAKMNEAIATPLWKNLKAVQNKHMYMKPIRGTKTGFGLIMYNIFVDEINKELLGG
ncbi:iron complex transport system substrate-binding protein [Paenibacillus sp. 1_12]|uniref:ABC transporter substrate-binding protein n=1 Tax=Paenibacillus sp. 1_12 TaxID=1566278 RepID=UPI0008E1F03F|nr:iron-siderophore ABC transporter substrate-binding protein [Paenibacillus sp. 1_12]SFL36156.1 iron complex transport system substrate-binding protein [Paenibacillus sp. 1_12]